MPDAVCKSLAVLWRSLFQASRDAIAQRVKSLPDRVTDKLLCNRIF
jgi:hypothetical protein